MQRWIFAVFLLLSLATSPSFAATGSAPEATLMLLKTADVTIPAERDAPEISFTAVKNQHYLVRLVGNELKPGPDRIQRGLLSLFEADATAPFATSSGTIIIGEPAVDFTAADKDEMIRVTAATGPVENSDARRTSGTATIEIYNSTRQTEPFVYINEGPIIYTDDYNGFNVGVIRTGDISKPATCFLKLRPNSITAADIKGHSLRYPVHFEAGMGVAGITITYHPKHRQPSKQTADVILDGISGQSRANAYLLGLPQSARLEFDPPNPHWWQESTPWAVPEKQ